MGRPRKWESEAERKRHERSRVDGDVPSPAGQGRTDEGVVRDPLAQDGPDLGTVSWEGKTWPVVRRAHVSESAYVAAAGGEALFLIDKGGLKDPDGRRVERAERYARWRYRGYLAGEVASL